MMDPDHDASFRTFVHSLSDHFAGIQLFTRHSARQPTPPEAPVVRTLLQFSSDACLNSMKIDILHLLLHLNVVYVPFFPEYWLCSETKTKWCYCTCCPCRVGVLKPLQKWLDCGWPK